MPRTTALFATLVVRCSVQIRNCRAAESGSKPLRASELLSLVAGNCLPENIVADINADHLAFRPDDFYRALLKSAGADPTILTALNSAKVDIEQSPEEESGKNLLQELGSAASEINSEHYYQASDDLKAALTTSLNGADSYFVVGDLLRRQSDWEYSIAAYKHVLSEDANFPEAHAKLSFVLCKAGDDEAALQEAELALKRNPSNAEAHKNAGLALDALRKFDASAVEYKEALRLKPDYWAAHLDLAILWSDEHNWNESIAEYKKAITLASFDKHALADTYDGMGWVYDQEGNFPAAMEAYRQVKALDPQRYDARQNLGVDLTRTGHAFEAVQEFRALQQLYPDAEMCAVGLGQALFATRDFAGAEKAHKRAIELDPTDPMPHIDLGDIYHAQKNYSAAVAEYEAAEKLDPTDGEAYRDAGRALIETRDFVNAAAQLEQAERLTPGDAYVHDYYGQAWVGLNKFDSAIAEFQQSLALKPQQIQVMLRLAGALEKKGDWVAAMGEYRAASLADSSIDLRGKVILVDDLDAQNEYKSAQLRLKEHLAALRASGKTSEAAAIESGIQSARANAGISDQLDSALQAGLNAVRSRQLDEGTRDFQQAVDLAEKIQPHDPRLVTALDDLGNCYFGWNAAAAESAYERELQAAQNLFGPESPNLVGPLQSLGRNALMQKDYATAEKFFFRAVDINEKAFGESSTNVADSLVKASAVYFVQKDYAKAEPYVLRAVNIDESFFGSDGIDMAIPLATLCQLYDRWGKPVQFERYNRQLMAVIAKQYGADSPVLVPMMDREVKTLRALGKNEEAQKLEDRAASLRSATMKPN
jgi:tetratricopeptide (TPR) repeat protein